MPTLIGGYFFRLAAKDLPALRVALNKAQCLICDFSFRGAPASDVQLLYSSFHTLSAANLR